MGFKNEKLDNVHAQTALDIARQRTQGIDATKGEVDYDAQFCQLRSRFGSARFLEKATEFDKLISDEELQQAAANAKKNEAAKLEKDKNSDYNQFMRALQEKPHSAEPLLDWAKRTSLAGQIETLREFQHAAAGVGLTIRADLVNFGLHFLVERINMKLP